VTYIPRAEPGHWRRTSPFFRPPELPQWPDVRTFVVPDPKALVPAGPPALDSADWTAALDEVRRLGAKTSVERTADQAVTAKFWSDFSYTTTPPGHWNEIAAFVARTRGFDERTTARMFAALNVAMADAGIVCWETKYRYNFWRPITALANEEWQPLLNTPAHPEYPSGHSAFSGAAAAVLAAFVGSDECEFTVRSDALKGVERKFTRFSDAALEISLSRVYGGIHYRFSGEAGLQIGREVATQVLRWNDERGEALRPTTVATR
jgi:membrane-associated phospholipid phosphatase